MTPFLVGKATRLPVGLPVSEQQSEYVIKTVALGLKSAGASLTGTISSNQNPLRLIVARTPVSVPLATRSTVYFLETLDCGHQVTAWLDWYWDEFGKLIEGPPKAKRRRCQECGEAQLALKLSPRSVPSPRKKVA